MKPYETEILAALRTCRAAFTERIVDEAQAQPAPAGQVAYPREALEQFVHGFFSFIEEALQGGTGDTRAFYMSTALPSIRDSGISAKLMIGGSVRTILRMSLEIARLVSVENRDEVERWLGDFFAEFIGDAAAVWAEPRG